MEFKVGDVVQLKRGGPKMTVNIVIGTRDNTSNGKLADEYSIMAGFQAGDVFCEWFDGSNRKTDNFKKEVLTLTSVS